LNKSLPSSFHNKFLHILEESFNVSVISKIELLGFPKLDTTSFETIKKFIKNAKIYHLNELIADKTINLRREYNIKLADAIIAATCLIYNFELITRNSDDFKEIKSLKLLNPYEYL